MYACYSNHVIKMQGREKKRKESLPAVGVLFLASWAKVGASARC